MRINRQLPDRLFMPDSYGSNGVAQLRHSAAPAHRSRTRTHRPSIPPRTGQVTNTRSSPSLAIFTASQTEPKNESTLAPPTSTGADQRPSRNCRCKTGN